MVRQVSLEEGFCIDQQQLIAMGDQIFVMAIGAAQNMQHCCETARIEVEVLERCCVAAKLVLHILHIAVVIIGFDG